MSENLELWSKQLFGLAALVACLEDKVSKGVPKEFIREALFGIESSINHIAFDMDEIKCYEDKKEGENT